VRRSPALAALSRDHHDALVVAMALARAGQATVHSSAMLFADFICEHEARHFALEEALLLPTLPPGERGRLLSERVLADHRHLREAAEQLAAGQVQPSAELVHSLGARLRAHVQLEERELFPYIEEALAPAALDAIGAKIEAAR
jgi:hemerythrin-like domain-containing protein